jgi:hypothetical protein
MRLLFGRRIRRARAHGPFDVAARATHAKVRAKWWCAFLQRTRTFSHQKHIPVKYWHECHHWSQLTPFGEKKVLELNGIVERAAH